MTAFPSGTERQRWSSSCKNTLELGSVTGPASVVLDNYYLWFLSAVKCVTRPARGPNGKMELESVVGKYAQGEGLIILTRGVRLASQPHQGSEVESLQSRPRDRLQSTYTPLSTCLCGQSARSPRNAIHFQPQY